MQNTSRKPHRRISSDEFVRRLGPSVHRLAVMKPGWFASDLRTPCGACALVSTFPKVPLGTHWRQPRPRGHSLRCSRSSMKKWHPAPLPWTICITNAIPDGGDASLLAAAQAPRSSLAVAHAQRLDPQESGCGAARAAGSLIMAFYRQASGEKIPTYPG